MTVRAVNADRFLRNWLIIQGVAFLLWLPWAIPFVIQSIKVDQEFWLGAPEPGSNRRHAQKLQLRPSARLDSGHAVC